MHVDNKAKWVMEFVDAVGNLEKALSFSDSLKRTVYPLVMDGKIPLDIGMTSDPNYISTARNLWLEFFEGNRYKVPSEVVDWMSRDKGAPWMVFAQLRAKAYEEGYRGGYKNFDEISADLRIDGALH